MRLISFFVSGNPVPKQSFRKSKTGGYTDPRVKAWEQAVGYVAKEFVTEQFDGYVSVSLEFFLKDKRVVDLDNLSKAVLDGLKKIAFEDDSLVTGLVLSKEINKDNPGVWVRVWDAEKARGEKE